MPSEPCPCGSQQSYNDCCGQYISGTHIAPDAESLMRSRYTAYQRGDVLWLVETWHKSQRSPELEALISTHLSGTDWLGLNVISHDYNNNSQEAFVTFFARYCEKNQTSAIYERSRFIREEQHWYYIDGVHLQAGRNDTCPCGSGRKYKKCCGQ
ncbi:YchJ family protein [Tatumella sp. UBA2305]|uniref:YchJ family protein n=1 Tax=Tatumella sp. UBA2305 TaxID=1947647 RepID=UPI0025DA4A0D|nr:YchJ family protein [Tatumella sp. UBA2305]